MHVSAREQIDEVLGVARAVASGLTEQGSVLDRTMGRLAQVGAALGSGSGGGGLAGWLAGVDRLHDGRALVAAGLDSGVLLLLNSCRDRPVVGWERCVG
jgi:hypothetical protein